MELLYFFVCYSFIFFSFPFAFFVPIFVFREEFFFLISEKLPWIVSSTIKFVSTSLSLCGQSLHGTEAHSTATVKSTTTTTFTSFIHSFFLLLEPSRFDPSPLTKNLSISLHFLSHRWLFCLHLALSLPTIVHLFTLTCAVTIVTVFALLNRLISEKCKP